MLFKAHPRSLDKKFCALTFLLLFSSIAIFACMNWLNGKFKTATLDAILFTLNAQIGGTPMELIYSFARGVILAPLGAAVLLTFIFAYSTGKFGVKKGFIYLCVTAVFCASLAKAAVNLDVYGFTTNSLSASTFIDDNYKHVTAADVVFPVKKKNLILIVPESLENTFYDEALGWNLIPYMQSLQSGQPSFSGQRQVYGTGYTVAGITSMLFGVPLKLPIGGNRYDDGKFKVFLPEAVSILEVLEGHGYSMNVMVGSDIGHGGRGNLFRTHTKKCNIYDLDYFKSRLDTKTFKLNERWGARDKLLFQEVKEIFRKLHEAPEPFFMFILTVDTHNSAIAYGDYPTPYGDERDSFVAADCMLKKFLEWIKGQDFFEDSVVAVIGDHFYMGASVGKMKIPASYQRSTYNVFLNSGYNEEDIEERRDFATFDLAPTLLESIGCKLPEHKFGLGVSLFSREKTLLERYGLATVNEELGKRSELYDSFFGF